MAEDKINSLFDVNQIKSEMQTIVDGMDSIIKLRDSLANQATSLFNASQSSQSAQNIQQITAQLKDVQNITNEVNTTIKEFNDTQVKLSKAEKEAAAAIKAKAEEERKAANAMGELTEEQKKAIEEQQKLNKAKKDYIAQLKSEASEGAEKTYRSVRAELRNVRNELATLINTGQGIDNPKVKVLAQRMDDLKDSMTKAKNMAELTDNAGKFEAFTKGVTGLSAAFEVANGVSGIFTEKNEEMQKVMMKVQSVIAITHGLQTLVNNLRKESTVWTGLEMLKTNALTAAQTAYNVVVGTSTGLLKGLRLAFAATGIGALILGIYELVVNWDKLTSSLSSATVAQKAYNDVKVKSIESSSKEIANLELIKKKLSDTTATTIDRTDALKDLDAILGTNLSTEKNINFAISEGNKLVEKKIELTKLEAEATAAKDLYSEALEKKLKAENSSLDDNISIWESLWANIKSGGNIVNATTSSIETGLENQKESISDAKKEMTTYEKLWDEANSKVNESKLSFDKLIKAHTDLKKENKDLKKEKTDEYTANEQVIQQIKLVNAGLGTGTENLKKYNEAKITYLETLEQLNKLEKDSQEYTDKKAVADKILEKAETEYTSALKKEIDARKKDTSQGLVGIGEMHEDLAKLKVQSAKDAEKAIEEINKKELENAKAVAAAEWELANKTANGIFEINSNVLDKKLMDLQDLQDADADAKEKELSNANLTQQQKDAIEAKYDNIAKQREAERKKIEHDKAVAKKAQTIFNIILDTAKGIMAALGEANPVLAGIIGATGAVELGVAMTQPIPKYAKGRDGGKAEMAIVGEAGHEMRIFGNEISLTPDTPTLTFLREGEKIIPNDKLVSMGMDLPSTAKNMTESAHLMQIVNKLSSVENAIKNKKETHFVGTEKGIKAIVKNGNSETEYINTNYKF